jgi:uncharacterized protein (TIGR01244 family)
MAISSLLNHRSWSRIGIAVLASIGAGFALAQPAELPNRSDAIEGVTTSGQPSEAALTAIAAAGYKAVIDLRGPDENRGLADEKKTVETLGMSYVSLPVEGGAGITYENARALDKLIAEADGPVLVHCSTSNRVGALLALRARASGADAETALELGLASGLAGLKSLVEQKLVQGAD